MLTKFSSLLTLTVWIFALGLFSCSGYRLKKINNPLFNDGITSISIPMFVNQSSLPNVSGVFTRAFFEIFHPFTDLIVYSGENRSADALLIGVLKTPKRQKEIFNRNGVRFTDPTLSRSLGDRPPFFVPLSSSYQIEIELTLIKISTSEIILQHSFNLQSTFNRHLRDNVGKDRAGEVNATMTDHFFEKSLQETAQKAALNFKELVLHAF